MANMSLEKIKMPEQAPDVRNKNFEEVAMGYTAEMAMEEATRCLNCKHKPCVSGCPVNVRIPEFIAEDHHFHKRSACCLRSCMSSGKSVRIQMRARYQRRSCCYWSSGKIRG